MCTLQLRQEETINLYLKEITDRYIQENFKRIKKMMADLEKATSGSDNTTVIRHNTTQRIPLDGSEPISGTLEPEAGSTYDIGSTGKPLRGLYSDEVHVSGNSFYVDGKKAINVDSVTGRLTYSSDPDTDLEVKSRGTGTLYIDSEGDIIINSSGEVIINGTAVANYTFGRDVFEIPTQIINTNQIVIGHIPSTNSEMVVQNGVVLTEGSSYDYTITDNTITFNSGVLHASGHILVNYSY